MTSDKRDLKKIWRLNRQPSSVRPANTHEAYAEHGKIESASNRSFGLTVGGILLSIGVIRWWAFDASTLSTAVFAGLGALLIVLGVAASALLAPLNAAWTRLGFLLARVVNPIIMLLIFSTVFVPMALVMRLRGRDALRLKLDPSAKSYWIERKPPGPAPEGMINQF